MRASYISIFISMSVVVCGCSRHVNDIDSLAVRLTVPESALLAISDGTSLDIMRGRLGIAVRHEFSIAAEGGEYTLISCYFRGGNSALWFVFRDKTLIKIIKPLSFPELLETYSFRGTTATRIKSWSVFGPDIMDRALKVINAPGLRRRDIIEDLEPGSCAGSEAPSVEAAALLSNVRGGAEVRIENDYRINEELLRRYDGCRIGIGMSIADVERIYGKPGRTILGKEGDTALIYGARRELEVNPQLAFSGLAVVANANGRVRAVFSGVFFDASWKEVNLTSQPKHGEDQRAKMGDAP